MSDRVSRRSFFRKTAAVTALGASGLVTNEDYEAIAQNVNTNSQPSQLKITDLRVVTVHGRNIIRLYTNQGLYGHGEIRDGASKTYALMLKSRILGMNPCNVDQIFRKIKQFGGPARQAGGVVSIEMACWDLAGKAWGVPCWQMLGGKFRDSIRLYADTPSANNPEEQARRLNSRKEHGFTFFKTDVGVELLRGTEGSISAPRGGGADPFKQWGENDRWTFVAHPFTGVRLTDKGLDVMEEYISRVRENIGWEVPLATDHYGHFYVEDGIKMARRFDKYNLAWLEDVVPWTYTDQLARLKNSCTTPILTGEDMYLKESFQKLFEAQAITICQPDLATAGGLLETKKIGDLAMEYGISMALHMAGHPVTMFSSIHAAAATENFLVMEHHNPDDAWYEELVIGPEKPFAPDGFVKVPDTPGLGIELNEEAIRSMIRNPERDFFAPTDEWDNERSTDRTWSMYTGKKDA